MNAESFVQYVQQLSRLYQLPYEELKSLSMQYPYFQNLHLLLALKSKLEDHPDYRRNLAKASAYSVDRAQLYRTLTKLEKLALENNFLMHEEVLELQEITKLEEKLKDLEILPEQAETLPIVNRFADPLPEVPTSPMTPEEPPLAIPTEKDQIAAPTPSLETSIQETPSTAVHQHKNIVADVVAMSSYLEIFHQNSQIPKPVVSAPATIAVPNVIETAVPHSETIVDTKLIHDAVALSTLITDFYPEEEITVLPPTPASTRPQAQAAPAAQELNAELLEKAKSLKAHLKKIKNKKPKPMPKKSFSTWIEQFQPAHVKPRLGDLMEAKKKEKINLISSKSDPTRIQGDNLNFFAQRSILENREMATETLAEILVAQMQYQKAIKVYERLILIFPEKSAFFADKIENLKKLIS